MMVSIIMPVYNALDFLETSVGDIRNQTYTDFELICVDDGSNDGSSEILDEYAINDSRIRVIHQENKGGGAARNHGLHEAKGKYVLFLDSDDRFEPDLLEKSIAKAESEKAEVLIYGGDTFDHANGKRKQASWLIKGSKEISTKNPFEIINTSVWNKLYLREHILNHCIAFQENRIVDTMYFVFMAVVYASKLIVVPDVLIHYRVNNSKSILSNSDRYPLEALDALHYIKEKLEFDGKFEEKKRIFAEYAAQYLIDRLNLMKTSGGYCTLYDAIHEYGIRKIGLEDFIENYSDDNENIAQLKRIICKSSSEFLFEKRKQEQECGLLRKESYRLLIPENDNVQRIVIYGGGNVGKDYVLQALSNIKIKLVGWVDRDFINIGFPLQPLNVLDELEYDRVILAVLSEKVAGSIREDLINRGIPDEKIYWSKPCMI